MARVGPIEISQYAVAPTLAGLLGLPVPPLADAPPAPELMDLPVEREVEILVWEPVLHLVVGSSEVMLAQLDRLQTVIGLLRLRHPVVHPS